MILFTCLGIHPSFDYCAGSFSDEKSHTYLNVEDLKGKDLHEMVAK